MYLAFYKERKSAELAGKTFKKLELAKKIAIGVSLINSTCVIFIQVCFK